MTSRIARALVSGTLAAAATAVAASLAGRRATGSYAAALNATSHVVWGEDAGRQNAGSLKYTATGLALNYGASILWALCYEWAAGRGRRSRRRALLSGASVAAVAYLTDYHVVPRRLTPGFEMRLPGKGLAWIYAALAFGLCARDLPQKKLDR